MRSGKMAKIHSSLPHTLLRLIGHSMSIRNLILGANSVTVSYLIHYDRFLQNTTVIIKKCDSYFITKRDFLLQNATILLQNATVITKVQRLLQIVTLHTP